MAAMPSRSTVLALVSIFMGAVLLPRLAGWAQPDRIVELSALVLAAIVVASLNVQGPWSADRAIMPPEFLVVFAALLLLGPLVATAVAAAAALTPAFVGPRGSIRQLLVDTSIAVAATYAAGFAFLAVGDRPGLFEWPWLAAPVAAAVILYHLVAGRARATSSCRWSRGGRSIARGRGARSPDARSTCSAPAPRRRSSK